MWAQRCTGARPSELCRQREGHASPSGPLQAEVPTPYQMYKVLPTAAAVHRQPPQTQMSAVLLKAVRMPHLCHSLLVVLWDGGGRPLAVGGEV